MNMFTREGVNLTSKKVKREVITEEEVNIFWEKNWLGNSSSQALLNTIQHGKLFGLRSTEHGQTTRNNFEVGDNFIKFEENASKTLHGGLTDLKYQQRVVGHICHPDEEAHEIRCFFVIYYLYICLAAIKNKNGNAFYFRPNKTELGFPKRPVGINMLSQILPNMCKAVGV